MSTVDKNLILQCPKSGINVTRCSSLHRIASALHFYHSMKNDPDIDIGPLILKYCTTEYSQSSLLDDYVHLLTLHINAGSRAQNSEQFSYIHDYISKHVQCDIKTCDQFVRNNRNRSRARNKPQSNENGQDSNNDPLQGIDDKQIIFYLDILDTIHCYFCHAFDVGFRIKANAAPHAPTAESDEKHTEQEDEIKADAEDEMGDQALLYKDDEMSHLKTYLGNKRKGLAEIAGLHRIENSKFMTTVTGATKTIATDEEEDDSDEEEEEEEQQQDLEEEEDNEKEKEKDNDNGDEIPVERFQFGTMTYYWPHYKQKAHAWYIERKYVSLKEEILNNQLQRLDMDQFDMVMEKATQFLNVDACRNLQSCFTNHKLYYDLKGGQPIGLNNILSIILYTDFTTLCYEFGKTFRRLNANESDESFKSRNSEYFNWAKALRETVEFYGEPLWKSKLSIFYSGCSYLVFDTFVANFYGPLSTTGQLSVAAIFAKQDGMILELEKADSPKCGQLRYFDCSFLSCYSSEDEKLFIGGLYPMHMHSIRSIKQNENYKHFIKALTLFNKSMNGLPNKQTEITKTVRYILWKLIDHELKQNRMLNANGKDNEEEKEKETKFPTYIHHIFDSFCRNKKVIRINLFHLREYAALPYNAVPQYFVKTGHIALLDSIATLFPNCNEIHINVKSEYKLEITQKYLEEIYVMIDKIMRSRAASTNHWNMILFHNVSNMQDINQDEHKAVFLGIDWEMKRVRNVPKFSNTNLKFSPTAKATAITDISPSANRRYNESQQKGKRKKKKKQDQK